jgi:hypothetical protein
MCDHWCFKMFLTLNTGEGQFVVTAASIIKHLNIIFDSRCSLVPCMNFRTLYYMQVDRICVPKEKLEWVYSWRFISVLWIYWIACRAEIKKELEENSSPHKRLHGDEGEQIIFCTYMCMYVCAYVWVFVCIRIYISSNFRYVYFLLFKDIILPEVRHCFIIWK